MQTKFATPIAVALLSAILTGCGSSPSQPVVKAQVPAVSGAHPLATFSIGETRKSKWLENGVVEEQTTKKIDANVLERSMSSGCLLTLSADNFLSPPLSRTNCAPGPWGTTTHTNFKKVGELWPLKVGNKVRYDYTSTNTEGKSNSGAYRDCEVVDTVSVKAAGKDYATYKTVCKEHSGTVTFYYAPSEKEIVSVRIERSPNRGDASTREFVEMLPLITAEAQAALAAAEADVKKAKAEFALWTTAESAFKAAQESAKTGDSEAVIKQAKKASALVELGLKQKSYPSTEMK